MNHAVVVRRAREADAAALLDLRSAIFAETEFMLWEPDEFKDTEADELRRITRLNGAKNSLCLVAEDRDKLVGFLNAMGGQVNRLRHSTTLALGVAQSHWRQGVGAALLDHVISWAPKSGVKRIELTVHTSNTRAVALYLRTDFQVEDTRRSSLFLAGRYVDEYLMSVVSEA